MTIKTFRLTDEAVKNLDYLAEKFMISKARAINELLTAKTNYPFADLAAEEVLIKRLGIDFKQKTQISPSAQMGPSAKQGPTMG